METDDKLVNWLKKRAIALKKDYDKAEVLVVKRNTGAKLKQVKDILHYIDVHKTSENSNPIKNIESGDGYGTAVGIFD